MSLAGASNRARLVTLLEEDPGIYFSFRRVAGVLHFVVEHGSIKNYFHELKLLGVDRPERFSYILARAFEEFRREIREEPMRREARGVLKTFGFREGSDLTRDFEVVTRLYVQYGKELLNQLLATVSAPCPVCVSEVIETG